MEPIIVDGTHVLISTVAYEFNRAPLRGEVVAFSSGEGEERRILLKRVIGMPNERVELRGGRVFIDGTALVEPYKPLEDHSSTSPVVVPPDSIFVLGDNRAESNDSRLFGPIRESAVIGKVLLVVWPLNSVKEVR